jgi:hypothetical protein
VGVLPLAGGEVPPAGGEVPPAGGEVPPPGGVVPPPGGVVPPPGPVLPPPGPVLPPPPVELPPPLPVEEPPPSVGVGLVFVGDPLPLAVGFADFDADEDGFPVVGPRLMPPGAGTTPLPVLGTVPDGPVLCGDADDVPGGAVVVRDRTDDELPLFEISTAMMAMTRTAAPTIPAIRTLREPGRCGGGPPSGGGISSGSTAYRSLLVSAIGKLGTTGRSDVDGPS